jgi:hypothetical protein
VSGEPEKGERSQNQRNETSTSTAREQADRGPGEQKLVVLARPAVTAADWPAVEAIIRLMSIEVHQTDSVVLPQLPLLSERQFFGFNVSR